MNLKIKIKKSITSVGIYNSLCFDDKRINYIIKEYLGGWINLCKMSVKDLNNFLAFEIVDMYNSLLEEELTDVPYHLMGLTELRKGIFDIHYVGGKEKCREWQMKQFKLNKYQARDEFLEGLEIRSKMIEY